jgi:hypothetical protein
MGKGQKLIEMVKKAIVIGNFAPSNSGKVESSVIGKIQLSKT